MPIPHCEHPEETLYFRAIMEKRSLVAIGCGRTSDPTGFMAAHIDNGRIWSHGVDNGQWHQGIGGGVWADLFGMAVLNISVTVSEEETYGGFGLSLDY